MKAFNFWQKWLLGVSLLITLFGLTLAFFGQSPIFNVMFNQPLAAIFWPELGIPETVLAYQAWMYGLLGAMVASWGLLIAFLAHFPFKARESWSWSCLAISIALWFTVDTSLSLFHGVNINAISNCIWLALLTLPLLFTRQYFFGRHHHPQREFS